MRKLLAFFLLASLVIVWSSSARAGLSDVRARGVLLWGGDLQGGEPYVSQRPDGTLEGFEVDIAEAIAKKLGVRQAFVQNDWSTLLP